MNDKRGARRAAEKAALAVLQKTMVGAAADLAEADQRRDAAEEELLATRDRAGAHVKRAKQEAAEMVATATSGCGAAQADYAQLYAAATSAGWSAATLMEMGYQAPDGRRARRGQRSQAKTSDGSQLATATPTADRDSRDVARDEDQDDTDVPAPGGMSPARNSTLESALDSGAAEASPSGQLV